MDKTRVLYYCFYAGVGDRPSSLARLYSVSRPLRMSRRRSGRAIGPLCSRRPSSVSICGQPGGHGGAAVQDRRTKKV
jgi:hypothetical protein